MEFDKEKERLQQSENEAIEIIAELQHKNQDLKQEIFKLKNYISILEKANDIAQQLNQTLREENEQLRTNLNNSIEME